MKKTVFLLWLPFVFSSALAQVLKVNTGSFFIMKGKVQLVISNAALINNGQFEDSSGTIRFKGTADSSINFINGANTCSIYNLTFEETGGAASLKSRVEVKNMLGVYSGMLYADSNLVLKSDSVLTARVDVIPATADIKGKVIIERFFPKRRAWRLLTSPLIATGSIFDNWQNKGVYQAGTNTLVSGPNPTGGAGNGLDASPQNNSSLKTWNVNTQSLEAVTNTKDALSAGNSGNADNTGYFMFVRGDRDPNNFIIPNSNNTTLISSGKLQTGMQTFTSSANAGGYTLIGNPYASPVDFNTVVRNNIVKRFYVWDPSLNEVGGYVMLDDIDGDGSFTKSVSSSQQNNHLQSSQAFFVQTLATAPASLVFMENSKSAGNNNALFRPASTPSIQSLRIGLSKIKTDSSLQFADEVLLECSDEFSDSVNADDALKFTNINEAIGLVRQGFNLTAERRPILTGSDTLFIKLSRVIAGRYSFNMHPANINSPLLQAWLEDSYLQTQTPVSLQTTTHYNFSVDNNTASFAGNRFRIVFAQSATLPVTFIAINAERRQHAAIINWVVANEINIQHYDVEKSFDGEHFSRIGTIMATAATALQKQYSFPDAALSGGQNYYRVKAQEINGRCLYSGITKLQSGYSATKDFTISPNPVSSNTIHLQTQQLSEGVYHFLLFNMNGQLAYQCSKTLTGNQNISITPSSVLPSGNYELKILTSNCSPIIKTFTVRK